VKVSGPGSGQPFESTRPPNADWGIVDAMTEPSAKPRRASPALLFGPALAGLIAFVLWWSTPNLGALAPYELDIVSPPGASFNPSRLGGEVPHVELAASGNLTLELRPQGASSEPVEVSAFLEGASLTALAGESVALPAGALRLTLKASELPPEGRLRVVVGRPGGSPGNPVGSAAHGRNWQRFDVAFTRAVAAP
jgi:hypothetical protein